MGRESARCCSGPRACWCWLVRTWRCGASTTRKTLTGRSPVPCAPTFFCTSQNRSPREPSSFGSPFSIISASKRRSPRVPRRRKSETPIASSRGCSRRRGNVFWPGVKRRLIDFLACPDCYGDLELEKHQTDGSEIRDGELRCRTCRRLFPIRRGVPRLLPANVDQRTIEVSASFSWEWNQFDEMRPHYHQQFLDWIQPLEPD